MDECGICGSTNTSWLSGEVGVVITLNGPVAVRCLDCGAEATLDEEED